MTLATQPMPPSPSDVDVASRRSSSLVVNALSNWSSLGVNVVIGFFLTPFVIAHLGQTGYGIWGLVGSILGAYGLLDLGVSSAVGRYVARYAARNDHQSLNATVSTALAFFLGVGLLIAAGFALVARPLGHAFLNQPERLEDFVWVLRVLGLATTVNLTGQVFRSLLVGQEQFVQRNAIAIGAEVLRAGLTVVVLLAGRGLLGVAVVTLTTDALATIAFVIAGRASYPQLRLEPRLVRWTRFRPLLTFGLTSSVIVAADLIRVNIDSVVIAWLVSVEAVAVYHVAMLLVRYAGRFVFSGMNVLTPRMAGLHGQNRMDEMRSLVLRSLWVSSLLTGGCCLMMVALGRQFIQLWVGSSFDGAFPVLAIFAAAVYVELAQLPAVNALYAMNRHKYLALTRSIEAVANFVLSVILARRLGIVGVAVGTLIPLLVVNLFIQPVYLSRLLGIGLGRFCLPLAGCLLPAVVVLGAWQMPLALQAGAMGWRGLFAAAVVLAAAYLAGVYAVQALSPDSPFRLSVLRRRMPRVETAGK